MSGQRPSDSGGPERVELSSPGSDDRPESVSGWIRWLLRTDSPRVSFAREVLFSVLGVVLVGLLLFAASGIWPPMVAVESGSMEPHMFKGDLVFVMEEHRLSPDYATGSTGVVTYRDAADRDGYWKFGNYGDVIVFEANGGRTTPVIHRARFWVEEGENWASKADPAFVPTQNCDSLPNCPAPHAGFVTKGDNNARYDQVADISGPVRPAWVRGTAEFRIPWLGYVRLSFTENGLGAPGSGIVPAAPDEGSPQLRSAPRTTGGAPV
ncbi:MAG TPA: S26 family signal peptidase [Halobacteriales archaeon]|nr:S26 family signal peptidase [Halobacteriales archaeon]